MSYFKENILQLLSATGYDLKVDLDRVNFVESSFTSWFNENISQENCITEEELTEFQALQDDGQVLYGKELDDALQEYYDSGAAVPIFRESEDIKQDELEHAQHQLDIKKQMESVLRSSLSSLQIDLQDQQQSFKNAETQQICVLKQLMAANNECNSALSRVNEIFKSLMKDVMELAPSQELSADEGIDTYSSSKFKSILSNTSSIAPTSSKSSSSNIENDSKYLCQMSLNTYNKQHIKFCKLLKDVLQKHLNKIQLKEGNPHSQVLVQNAMDRLFHQKLQYIELTAELAGINSARNKLKETEKEIKCQLWKPTQSVLRSKIADIEDNSILNCSETSSNNGKEELITVCNKWADFKILRPIVEGLTERIQWDQFIVQKLDELVSIMNVRLAIDSQLCEKMYFERDQVTYVIDMYNEMRDRLEARLEASKTRMDVMKENQQDYNDHFANARRELVECLAVALGCNKTEICESYKLLQEQSHNHHQEFVQSCNEQLQILAAVHKDLKNFYFEEEEKKLIRQEMSSNQDHFDSIRQTLELISHNLEDTNVLCHIILENK